MVVIPLHGRQFMLSNGVLCMVIGAELFESRNFSCKFQTELFLQLKRCSADRGGGG